MELAALICGMAMCGWEIDTWGELASQLPPCPTEDSADCYWDADRYGVSGGQSFVAIDKGDTVTLFYEPMGDEIAIVTYSK